MRLIIFLLCMALLGCDEPFQQPLPLERLHPPASCFKSPEQQALDGIYCVKVRDE
jgi:hypothetical protein